MNWDKLRVFHAVAVAGGFTHAEEILHISHPSISRHVNQLEHELQATLFHRHPRGLHLTGAGKILFESVQDIYDKLDQTRNRIIDSTNMPRGPLKISTAFGFGAVWLTQEMRGFIEKYPEMDIQIVYEENLADLSMGEADIAIRIIKEDQADLIYTPFINFKYGLYASKEYLKHKGTPQTIEDLQQHNVIGVDAKSPFPTRNFNWFLNYKGVDISPAILVSNAYAIYISIKAGIGIGMITDLMAQNEEDLVNIGFSEESNFDVQTYFAYPIELRKTERVRVLIHYMKQRAKQEGTLQ